MSIKDSLYVSTKRKNRKIFSEIKKNSCSILAVAKTEIADFSLILSNDMVIDFF